MASAVGPVATDGGDWLVFLKKFRRIVEGDGEPAGKIATIERLVEMAEASAEFRMVRHLLDG